MDDNRHLVRGLVAGMAGGLVASWVMNLFIAGPGQKIQQAVQTEQKSQDEGPKEDATMKTADAIVSVATGGHHLSWEQKQKAGPVVHYAFGGAMGALYGGLAELWPGVRAGFGTTFATALFTGADLIAVPVLNLGSSPADEPARAQLPHLAAHLVYGASTEAVRRLARAIL